MENDVVDLLGRVASGIHARLELLPVLEELGLPAYQAKLLVLATHHPGWSQQHLASATGRDKAQVTRALRELETRGLVTRTTHASDTRAHGVAATDAGRSSAQRIARDRLAVGAGLVGQLTPADQNALAGLLKQLLKALDRGK